MTTRGGRKRPGAWSQVGEKPAITQKTSSYIGVEGGHRTNATQFGGIVVYGHGNRRGTNTRSHRDRHWNNNSVTNTYTCYSAQGCSDRLGIDPTCLKKKTKEKGTQKGKNLTHGLDFDYRMYLALKLDKKGD